MSPSLTLQARWRVVEANGAAHLLYYGVRNPPRHREQRLEISAALAEAIGNGQVDLAALGPQREEAERLAAAGILVAPEEFRDAKTPETMQVCTRCVTNDYVIPGLEFNERGVCALCQCYEQSKGPSRAVLATITPEELKALAAENKTSRFDAMVLYTGGKDSSYMLWLLARKLGLRVLAAFWAMPYCSDAAYENIRRAKRRMPEVEFVEWTLPERMVREAMESKWRSQGWPCLCPTAAFPTLYPLAAHLRIPCVFLGLEDVQAAVLDHVFSSGGGGPAAEPTRRERTLSFLEARAVPRALKDPVRWADEMSNYHAAVVAAMPELFRDLEDLVRRARRDPEVHLPLVVRLATNEEYGSWGDARRIIETEMDWRAPAGQNNLLHTSCAIEPVKDYLQFQRFKAMRTVFMPQSIVETGAAVFFGLTSREEGLKAVEELGYWRPPAILDRLAGDLGVTPAVVRASSDEMHFSLEEWAAGPPE